MRKLLLILMLSFAATAAEKTPAKKSGFTLSSTSFKNGGTIPDKYVFNSFGCSGGNTSPQLSWQGAPEGTKSFALMVHDPDAPTGSGWWHWVVYNIPADTKEIPEGGPVPGTEGNTDFGKPGWGGPCPPPGSGNHHYNFTLFALKTDKLDIPKDATAAFVGFNVHGAMLGKAKLTGLYGRK